MKPLWSCACSLEPPQNPTPKPELLALPFSTFLAQSVEQSINPFLISVDCLKSLTWILVICILGIYS